MNSSPDSTTSLIDLQTLAQEQCPCAPHMLSFDGIEHTEQHVRARPDVAQPVGERKYRTIKHASRRRFKCRNCGNTKSMHRRRMGDGKRKNKLRMKRLEKRFALAEAAGNQRALANIEHEAGRLMR